MTVEYDKRTRGFCMIMTDQRSSVRKLEVPANGASMQLSMEPRHHLHDWDQAKRENPSCLVIPFI